MKENSREKDQNVTVCHTEGKSSRVLEGGDGSSREELFKFPSDNKAFSVSWRRHSAVCTVWLERVVLDVQYMMHHSLFNVKNGTSIRLELSPILGQNSQKQDESIEAWSISEGTHKWDTLTDVTV